MKLFQNIFLLLVLVAFTACKNDKKTSETAEVKSDLPTNPENLTVPNSCSFLTVEWIKANLNLQDKDVTIKDATDPTKKDYTSCFFKWVNSDLEPDAGILIQIMVNPVYDEFPMWVTKFISAKLTDGESTVDGQAPVKFKKFEAGLEGAYSFESKRFYWRNDDKFLFMLAFNINDDENTLVGKAEKIVAEINKNFKG
jgi:hypothetical protein